MTTAILPTRSRKLGVLGLVFLAVMPSGIVSQSLSLSDPIRAKDNRPFDAKRAKIGQPLISLTSKVEMAGEPDKNEIAAAANRRIDQVWPAVVARDVGVPEYVEMFADPFDEVSSSADTTAVQVAHALDDFQNSEWQAHLSPFDAYIEGDKDALKRQEKRELDLLNGKAGCASCQSGPLLTDQIFYALALPPLEPGRPRRFDLTPRDVGRMAETENLEDAYPFRTPSLRNVELTGPWGHNGAYSSMEGIVLHHLDPLGVLDKWDISQAILPEGARFEAADLVVWQDRREMDRLRANLDIVPIELPQPEFEAVIAFLSALTDQAGTKGRLGKPTLVPSGLAVD